MAPIRGVAAASHLGRVRITTRLVIDDRAAAGMLEVRLASPREPATHDIAWTSRGVRPMFTGDAAGPLLQLAWGDGRGRAFQVVQTLEALDVPALPPVWNPHVRWERSAEAAQTELR